MDGFITAEERKIKCRLFLKYNEKMSENLKNGEEQTIE